MEHPEQKKQSEQHHHSTKPSELSENVGDVAETENHSGRSTSDESASEEDDPQEKQSGITFDGESSSVESEQDDASNSDAPKTQPSESPVSETDRLTEGFERLMASYRRDGGIPKKQRKRYLKALRKGLRKRRAEFVQAVSEDFRGRSPQETLSADIYPVVSGIKYILRHLDEWMEPERVEVDILYWPSRAEIQPKPLGVVGVISPWNYPVHLALVPIVEAVAAGNRVYLKPSEYAPKTSALLERFLADIFPNDVVAVIQGKADIATRFSRLPFHHLFFTGSVAVGRKVMEAASEHLTPVTLELGGKSPAIIHSSYSMKKAAKLIAGGKLINSGQTCIAPDYVLCPTDQVDEFVTSMKNVMSGRYVDLPNNEDYTSIIHDKHFLRLKNLLQDAQEKGATIIELASAGDSQTKLAPHLVLGATSDMLVMQEEIFGPILPVVAYGELEEAIQKVQDGDPPLALYYFDNRSKRIRQVLTQISAGGASVNSTILHIAQENLPFGGVGTSGMGVYHGKHGFDTFSQQFPVYYHSRLNPVPALLRPPYPAWVRWLVRLLLWR